MNLSHAQQKEIGDSLLIDRVIKVSYHRTGGFDTAKGIEISVNALNFGLPVRLSTVILYLNRMIGEANYRSDLVAWVDDNPNPTGLDPREVQIAQFESQGKPLGEIAELMRLWEISSV